MKMSCLLWGAVILLEGEELGKDADRKHISNYVQCGTSYKSDACSAFWEEE